MQTFCIERLKAVKLIPQSRGCFPVIRERRNDLLDKLRREAIRVLDRGRDVGGVRGRQLQSPRFDDTAWVDSFVKMRLAYLPKKQVRNKLVSKARHLVIQGDAETVWCGISYLETCHALHPDIVTIDELDEAIARYWEMRGLLV